MLSVQLFQPARFVSLSSFSKETGFSYLLLLRFFKFVKVKLTIINSTIYVDTKSLILYLETHPDVSMKLHIW
jgi:hypothetical protein